MRSNAIRSLTLLTATAATVAAESTVSLFMPYADPASFVAEVLGSSGSATTYRVNCASAGDDCGMPSSGYTIIQGASTVKQIYSFDDYYVSYGCNLGGTTSISCLISQMDSTTTQVTDTDMTTDIGSFFLPVVVTGTATAGAHATTPGASVTGGTPSATGKTTLASSGPSATSGAQATGSSASASPSHSSSGNAAMPQITGNANWAIGGAAMAMALALA